MESKSKGGTNRDFNYSIKDKVVNTLTVWENLKKGFPVEGGQVCDLIQLIPAKFLTVI